MKRKTRKKSIPQLYQAATKGLQNIGRNFASTTAAASRNFSTRTDNTNYYKGTGYWATHKNKKKPRLEVDNKTKGSYGETILQKGKKPIIKINVKKHKGDRAELADTIRHELMHAKHPKMKEKTVYKKVPKTISPAEQTKLIARLRMKKNNYKKGAIKRKLKISRHEKLQPGDLIRRAKAMSPTERTAIMGMV